MIYNKNDLLKIYPNAQWNHIVDFANAAHSEHLLILTQVLLAHKIPAVHLLHIYAYVKDEFHSNEMLSGFAKSLHQEHPSYFYQVIGVDETYFQTKNISTLIFNEFTQQSDIQVRYCDDARFVHRVVALSLEEGLGGLGLIFAKYLAENYQAKLILIGRSKLNKEKQILLYDIKQLGGEALYIASDISDFNAIKNTLKQGQEKFGALNGIIHATGVLKDSFIIKKTRHCFLRYLLSLFSYYSCWHFPHP